MRVILLCAAVFLAAPAWSGPVATYEFASQEQEELFNKLSNELRCLVCQNQAISDSNADLAKDLRDEMYGMLRQGKTEKEIVDFMVARYGDLVLYRPPMKPVTWVLWFGPAIALVAGFFLVMHIVRKQKRAAAAEISGDDMERLKALQSEAQQMHKSEGGAD